jgi:hypothetical protein
MWEQRKDTGATGETRYWPIIGLAMRMSASNPERGWVGGWLAGLVIPSLLGGCTLSNPVYIHYALWFADEPRAKEMEARFAGPGVSFSAGAPGLQKELDGLVIALEPLDGCLRVHLKNRSQELLVVEFREWQFVWPDGTSVGVEVRSVGNGVNADSAVDAVMHGGETLVVEVDPQQRILPMRTKLRCTESILREGYPKEKAGRPASSTCREQRDQVCDAPGSEYWRWNYALPDASRYPFFGIGRYGPRVGGVLDPAGGGVEWNAESRWYFLAPGDQCRLHEAWNAKEWGIVMAWRDRKLLRKQLLRIETHVAIALPPSL